MLVNLASAYSTDISLPRSQEMAFYSATNPDFLFESGQPIVLYCQPLKRALSLKWSLSRNGIDTPFATGCASPEMDNSFVLKVESADLTPGFYDFRVTGTLTDSESISGTTTFGWSVFDQPLVETKPADFEEFWSTAVGELANTPIDLHCEEAFQLAGEQISLYNIENAALPEHYDPAGELYHSVEVYRVDFQSVKGRVHGWFAKPAGVGPFPALLVLPGAGNSSRPAPVEHARHGYAALDIQVHGYPADMPRAHYPEICEDITESPKDYLFYKVYLNALQAVNALAALPGVDPDRISVCGGSQGGRLSIVAAALDPRIKAAIPAIAYFAYAPRLRWTNALNLTRQGSAEDFTTGDVPHDEISRIHSYYDIVNFAPLVKCPTLLNAGLTDATSPPSGIYALYRGLNCLKRIIPLPNSAHDWRPAFDTFAWRWLDKVLASGGALNDTFPSS